MISTKPASPMITEAADRARVPRRLRHQGGRVRKHRKFRIVLYVVAGAVLAASTVVTVTFRHDMGEARDRLAAQPTEIFKSNYGDVQYRVSGDGPPVLVVHGITGGVDQAEAIVTQWRNLRPDYRFIYVSRFGYLQSAMPHDATVRMQAAAYRELLDYLRIDRVFVVGNSAGGPSATWFAIDFPERINGLTLISSAVPGPLPGPIPPLVATHDFVYWAAVKAAPEQLLGMLMPKSVIDNMSREQKAFAVEHAFVDSMPISERTDGILFDNDVTNPGVNDVPFERISTPTLVFQAVDDPREHSGGLEMARRIPDSKFIGLTGGHLLTGHATEIRTTSAEFIARHMSR
jgi:pimeloyl-ACP methyl ester carboxylesterase